MPSREELIHALTQLDPATFEEVLNSAYQQRHEPADDASVNPPDPQTTPEQFARWLARRHMSSDAAIEQVVYLPAGAPPHEIRLLELNRFLNPPAPDVIEPLDFTPDNDLPFTVFVADITKDQWERIQREPDAILPEGWNLEDYQILTRG